ncbi:MAG: DNA-binding protein [Vibrio sp.]|uniref:DNA-binding protein n=1 Tax=Vibrio sp. TaxID=678 RepID=UPI003A8A1607
MKQKEWFQSRELIGLLGMPTTQSGIAYKAKNENWLKRKPEGVKGRAFEYHIDSFPSDTQKALGWPEEVNSGEDSYKKLQQSINDAPVEVVDKIYQKALRQGIDSLYFANSERDERLLALVSDLNDEEFKEIFAFVRKAKYMLLAGLKVDPAMNVDIDNDDRKVS